MTASKRFFKWTSELAYAVGLLTTDGSLSKDGRHINLTSKDLEQVINFQRALGVSCRIGMKSRDRERIKKYYYIQVGDVGLYKHLLLIGLFPNKTKTIKDVQVPEEYFFDFLRGHFDGDGTFYSYWDKRWVSSYMFYLSFLSASYDHIDWLQGKILSLAGVKGHISKSATTKGSYLYRLRYAKIDSQKLFEKMYPSREVLCLTRKRIKVEKALQINLQHARVL